MASHHRNLCLFIRLDPIISYVPVQELKLSVVRFTVDSEVIGRVIVVFLVFTHVTNCLTTVAIRHVGVAFVSWTGSHVCSIMRLSQGLTIGNRKQEMMLLKLCTVTQLVFSLKVTTPLTMIGLGSPCY